MVSQGYIHPHNLPYLGAGKLQAMTWRMVLAAKGVAGKDCKDWPEVIVSPWPSAILQGAVKSSC